MRSLVYLICEHHGVFSVLAKNHIGGSGCPLCTSSSRYLRTSQSNIDRIKKNIINDFKKIHGDRYDYSLVDYQGRREKVKIVCKVHGEFEQIAGFHKSGSGCPFCNESRGERTIAKFLDKFRIKYFREKRFKDCRFKKPLPFDFYLPEMNTCIEYDGVLHFFPNLGEELLRTTKRNDDIKTNFCKQNNINLIRISFTENIEEVIKRFIIYQFSTINCSDSI